MASPVLPQSQHHILESVPLLVLKIFAFTFLVETVYALLILTLLGTSVGEEYAVGSLSLLWITHTLKFALEISVILRLVMGALSTRYYIAGDKLIFYQGAFSQTEKVFDLDQLRSIEVSQSWLGRHLKYGDLHLVLTSSGYQETVHITGVNDPRKYERVLKDQFLVE